MMKCKICNEVKSDKNFHRLENGLDNCCSQCRAKEKIAKRRGEGLPNVKKGSCFADNGTGCEILKEKDCYKCAFFKTQEEFYQSAEKARKD